MTDSELVESYRQLIKTLIANDDACPGFMCPMTMLGHLLAGLSEEQIELVRELDETDGVIRRDT